MRTWKMKYFWNTPKSISASDCMPARLFMKVRSIGSSARNIFSTRPVAERNAHELEELLSLVREP